MLQIAFIDRCLQLQLYPSGALLLTLCLYSLLQHTPRFAYLPTCQRLEHPLHERQHRALELELLHCLAVLKQLVYRAYAVFFQHFFHLLGIISYPCLVQKFPDLLADWHCFLCLGYQLVKVLCKSGLAPFLILAESFKHPAGVVKRLFRFLVGGKLQCLAVVGYYALGLCDCIFLAY